MKVEKSDTLWPSLTHSRLRPTLFELPFDALSAALKTGAGGGGATSQKMIEWVRATTLRSSNEVIENSSFLDLFPSKSSLFLAGNFPLAMVWWFDYRRVSTIFASKINQGQAGQAWENQTRPGMRRDGKNFLGLWCWFLFIYTDIHSML